ncbi:MAG: hypothetical protein PHW62_06040 [Candidatus Ratteibacteria bacterium]|nr:hypothetical protein [Candidatus Ratteibacteria bacterium]
MSGDILNGTAFCIEGSRWPICLSKIGFIIIGCQEKEINEWIENIDKYAEEFDAENVKDEYLQHIKYIQKMQKIYIKKGYLVKNKA